MPKTLLLTPQAQNDLDNAYTWYEDRDQGLGKEFIRCIDAQLTSINRNPLQYPIVFKGSVRRALTNRFPFSIYYLDEAEVTTVVAILHQSRDPESWKART